MMTTDEKIHLTFFDVEKPLEEYNEYYKNLSPGIDLEPELIRYSPVLLLLRDTRHCFALGKEFNLVRTHIGEAQFAGTILISILLTNVIKSFYLSNFEDYAFRFMGIKKEHASVLRYLRNGLEHSFYSLHYSLKNKVEDTEKRYYFQASQMYDTIQPVFLDSSTEIYGINPRKFYTSTIKSLKSFKELLLDPREVALRKNFEEKCKLDEWIFIKK